jgi:hypothetical protein
MENKDSIQAEKNKIVPTQVIGTEGKKNQS